MLVMSYLAFDSFNTAAPDSSTILARVCNRNGKDETIVVLESGASKIVCALMAPKLGGLQDLPKGVLGAITSKLL